MSEHEHDTHELTEEELQEANGGGTIFAPANPQDGVTMPLYKCTRCGLEKRMLISREGNTCPSCGSPMTVIKVYNTRPESGGWQPTNLMW